MTTFRHRVTGPGPAGDIWTCTLHSVSGQSLTTVHAAWASAVQGFINSTLGPLWPTETQATAVWTDQLDPVTGRNVAQAYSAGDWKGTGTGLQLPQRAAVIVGLRTALPTRSGRGRMFWPAPDSTHLTTTGLLASATAQTIATGWASQLQTMTGTTQPVIFHRKTKTSDSITSVTVGQVLGTQRRRTNKVPPNYSTAAG